VINQRNQMRKTLHSRRVKNLLTAEGAELSRTSHFSRKRRTRNAAPGTIAIGFFSISGSMSTILRNGQVGGLNDEVKLGDDGTFPFFCIRQPRKTGERLVCPRN
jgi:hypothetical protein